MCIRDSSKEKWRYKGRICFRGDIVKDELGQAAVFAELSASPTNVSATNACIGYGLIEGHKISCSDAIRAYIQSVLDSAVETWVLLPREVWPPSWHHRGFVRPVVRLIKSLYGHPDSGGYWERHLNKAPVSYTHLTLPTKRIV